MGCDIHSVAIDANGKRIEGGKWADSKECDPEFGYGEGEPFGWRNYSVFGFLADVRNYSEVTPIRRPRGLPDDLKDYDSAGDPVDENLEHWLGQHSYSWLSIAELIAFDYDHLMVDRRGKHEIMSFRDFLGPAFFQDLAELQRIGADRVVFGFDS